MDDTIDNDRAIRITTMISSLMSQMERIEGKVDLLEQKLENNSEMSCKDLDSLTDKIMAALELRDVKQATINNDLESRVDFLESHVAILDHRVEQLESQPAKIALAGWKKVGATIGFVVSGVLLAYVLGKLGIKSP